MAAPSCRFDVRPLEAVGSALLHTAPYSGGEDAREAGAEQQHRRGLRDDRWRGWRRRSAVAIRDLARRRLIRRDVTLSAPREDDLRRPARLRQSALIVDRELIDGAGPRHRPVEGDRLARVECLVDALLGAGGEHDAQEALPVEGISLASFTELPPGERGREARGVAEGVGPRRSEQDAGERGEGVAGWRASRGVGDRQRVARPDDAEGPGRTRQELAAPARAGVDGPLRARGRWWCECGRNPE